MRTETQKVLDRYERRNNLSPDLYSPLTAAAWKVRQEKERLLIRWIKEFGLSPVSSKRLLEIGCGSGDNFLEFLRLGFRPENMRGIELIPERAMVAKHSLPAALNVIQGDALEQKFPEGAFHIVFQSGVFTSILDTDFQQALASRMWNWAAPGGGVLWYDFVYDNPRNDDVRGVPLRRIRQLFPLGRIRHWRVTLAPPINRAVTRVHPFLYTVLNSIPALRTHILCWIEKE